MAYPTELSHFTKLPISQLAIGYGILLFFILHTLNSVHFYATIFNYLMISFDHFLIIPIDYQQCSNARLSYLESY
jgi:hypothetical protein